MRSDFIGHCEAFLGLPEAVSHSQFLVPRLDRKQMEEAIVRPGEVRTAVFQPFTFQQDLVNRIINEAGDRPDQLPLMQHALLRTWKQAVGRDLNEGKLVLSHEDYENAGQIEQALSRDAEAAWDKIKSDARKEQLTRHLFLLLCDISSGKQITRRRPQVSEVMAVTGATVGEVEKVVREFQADDRNFLLPPCDESLTPDKYLDVSHEALLRQWSRFSEWLEKERRAVAELRLLVDRAQLYRGDVGTLLQSKDLDRVSQWQKDNLPSAEWAQRYVTLDGWNEAETFIKQSTADVKQREAIAQQERERFAREEKERQEREFDMEFARRQAEAERAAVNKVANKLRRRAFAAAGAAVAALILATVTAFMWAAARKQAIVATRERNYAEKQRVAAQTQESIATAQRLANASSALLGKDIQISLLLAVEAVKAAEAARVRVAEAKQSLLDALGSNASRLFTQSGSKIYSVALSLDVHWLVTGSSDGRAWLWDLTAKDPAANLMVLRGHTDAVTTVAISHDNRWLVTGSFDKTVRLWDLAVKDPAANPVVLRGHEGAVTTVAISTDSRWLMTGSEDGTARLWNLTAKDPAADPVVLLGHEGAVTAVAISPDSRWLITGSQDHTARLWDLAAKDPASRPIVLRGHEGAVTAVAFSPDGRWVMTGSEDGTARLWDLAAKDPAANPVVLPGHTGAVTAVAISPDARWLVTGSLDKTARLWNPVAKDPATSSIALRGQTGGITAIAISPDARWLVTGSEDHTARLWDLTAKDPTLSAIVLSSQQGAITAVAISENNRWIATGSLNGIARLWLLQVNDLVALARGLVGRNFSTAEWQFYFPGEEYRKTFNDLPGPG